ncbi:monovalent cation/H+ antiporter subunit D [Ideonella sp. A 288]|uniref:monovalent cation/H+ antiporter subunit D n=1 Tax=Ideonella sp. A 288 TaxID=1962181 RepID=UPI001F34120F|nr:monovalent cation/H+ antiporter subunit D [Ideonella sp. A 288]
MTAAVMTAAVPLPPIASLLPGGHEIVLPIVLPLVAGALLLLLEQRASRWVPVLSAAAVAGLVALAMQLVAQADHGAVQPYLVGNWAAPYGITLALDRLSALMLLVTALVAAAALTFALAGDDRRHETPSRHFHALFQFQLMGLNGAFLTADLFNLFVFFEVLLAASYGLLLHGAGRQRLKAGVHYVVFNLAGSALFLVAVSLLYAVAGTLNMADLANKLPLLAAENQRLAQAALLMLLVVFAVKAALLPLYFWLPDTYASASAPTAALFAVLTKVGVYAIVRATTLFVPAGLVTGESPLLTALALATLVLAALGTLAAAHLRTLVAYLVVASAGTLLLAVGLGSERGLAAGLFYLVPSTLVACAWFLLADRIAAARGGTDLLLPGLRPAAWAPLGTGFFIAAVAVAGVPPLAAFMGKALLLQAAGNTPWAGEVVAGVLASSLMVMVALARAGSALFWESGGAPPPGVPDRVTRPGLAQAATGGALAMVVLCAVAAGPIAAYTAATAAQLFARQGYVQAVLGARPVPAAIDVRREMRERGVSK